MKFLYPEFLWSFTALLIPIIIHLFNFKRYKTLYFSSLSFVKHIDQKTKSIQQLRHYLILASRLLAFICLVLAFAQPYFSDSTEKAEAKHSTIAFYIDNSFSMEAKGAEGELLSEARENARSIIEKAPMNTRFLIGTNEMSGSEERILNKVEAYEKLDKIELSPYTRSLDEVMNWQDERFNEDDLKSESGRIQYIMLSDFQKSNRFNSHILKAKDIEFYPIKLSPESVANIYIDSVWYTSPLHKINSKNELNIRVVNDSDQSLENVEILIAIDTYKKTIFIDLPANQKTTTEVGYMDKTSGIKSGKIHVMDDHVLFDDTYYLSYEVKKNVKILILHGEDAVPNFASVYGLDNYYEFTEREITQITRDDFQGKDLVVINGENEITSGMLTYLQDFVKTGGSLGLFPGKTPERGNWNALLRFLELPTLGSTISSGNRINSINYDDPFYAGVFENRTDRLNLPSVSAVFQAQESTESLSSPLIGLQNGLPLLAYTKEQGAAFMFYSSLHSDFGGFTHDALFSTIALRMGEISQRLQPYFLIIGKDTRYPIYAKIENDVPVHITNESFDLIPQHSTVSGVKYISLNKFSNLQDIKAGNYDLETNKTIGALSLNYDRRESNLKAMSEAELTDWLESNGAKDITFNEIGSDSHVAIIDIDKPFSYWKIFIILTFIFVLIEMLLVRFLK